MSEETYAALADAAERMKLRALTKYAQLHRRDASLAVEIAKLSATLGRESAALAPGDLSAALALQRYASVAARQSDHLLAEKRALAPDLQAARREAVRANGRTEAISILAAREREEARRRQARQAERSTPGG